MLKTQVKYTPKQLLNRLNAAGYKKVKLTRAQLASVDTAIEYRYAKVLANTGPYQQFVWAYIQGLATQAPWRDTAYTIMMHAVTEMRRAYQNAQGTN